MQPVKFRSVEDFLSYLPPHELAVVQALRHVVLACIPGCTEKLAYNVPYYYRHSRICFIWPASVPWGNVRLHGVQLGFCEGHLLSDPLNYLEKGTRKQVSIKTFTRVDEIDAGLLKTFLFEAAEVDKARAAGRSSR